jgi:elongation factor P hydroxylase
MSGLSDRQIAGCFNTGLGRLHGVRLIGGAAEPFYLPGNEDRHALIRYTRDYAASALHELAHWCIAGESRRGLPDYGYWYEPPPRSVNEQAAFFRVEVPVQALEAGLAAACGLPFRVSMDDLTGADTALEELRTQVRRYLDEVRAVPPRAQRLRADLRRLRTALGRSGDQLPGYPDLVAAEIEAGAAA